MGVFSAIMARHMGAVKNAASSLLLACGIVLTFAGLISALGSTPVGMLASVAVIAALLYAGGVWLGRPPMPAAAGTGTIVVFDRSLRVVSGPSVGSSVATPFPREIRSEIETRCLAALRGEPAHFVCEHGNARFVFDAAPVPSLDGMAVFGVLISGAGVRERDFAAAPATTLAQRFSAH